VTFLASYQNYIRDRRFNMATKNGPVTKSAVVTLDLYKEHGKVVQFRSVDQATAILTGGVYVSKSFLGKSPKSIEITIKEV